MPDSGRAIGTECGTGIFLASRGPEVSAKEPGFGNRSGMLQDSRRFDKREIGGESDFAFGISL